MAKTSKTVEVSFDLDEVKTALVEHALAALNLQPDDGSLPVDNVFFDIKEVDCDPMDRFPGRPALVGVRVVFKR